VRMPVKGATAWSKCLAQAARQSSVRTCLRPSDPWANDLVVLAMQEPQYRLSGVRELLDAVARASCPACRS